MGTIAGVDAGECDSWTVHLSGSAVDDFKAQLAPWFESTNASAQTCAGLSPEARATWDLFYRSWRAHLARSSSSFFAFEAWRATCVFARSLDAWRATLAGQCNLPGPRTVEAPTPEILTVIKWAAAAVIAAAVVYGVTKVIP
jgi:hypothetical protein